MSKTMKSLMAVGGAAALTLAMAPGAVAEPGSLRENWGAIHYSDKDNARGNDSIRVCDTKNLSHDYDHVVGYFMLQNRRGRYVTQFQRTIMRNNHCRTRYFENPRELANVRLKLCRVKQTWTGSLRVGSCVNTYFSGKPVPGGEMG